MNGLVSQIIMIGVGLLLIYLAIKKEMEPTLLLPMGFGAILVNLPGSVIALDNGILGWLYNVGIETAEVFPLLLFIGIGAMIDFGPVLSKPWLIFIGAAGQGGIFISMIVAAALGFSINDAASIGIIGAADGPTAILVSQRLMSQYVPAILVVAYCYMALVPIIQPVVLKICTTKKERCIRMHYSAKSVSKSTRILFPIITTIVCGTIAPDSAALVGMLMFGNLLRECGVLDSLSLAAQNMLSPLITLLLGLAIAPQMQASSLLQPETIMIMGFGLVAFAFDTACGVFFVKIANIFLKKGHKVGLHVQAHSTFKQTLEVFEYKDKAGGDLFFYFPHDQRKAQTKYSIIPLREPQGPFTCKLRLEQDPQNGGRPHIFYSGPELILKGVQEAPLPYSTRRQIGQWLESAVWPTQLQSAPQEG